MQNDFSAILKEMFASTFSGEPEGEIASRAVLIENETYVYQIYLPPEINETEKSEKSEKGGKNETDEKLPLIVFLHGIRERGEGGFINGMFAAIVRQYLKKLPAIVLLPQCRPGKFWNDAQMDKMVIAQIGDLLKDFSIDETRKYLMGVSMGGYGAWHFAANYPKDFAAIVSICGGSPLKSGNRFAPIAKQIGKTPAWIFHGSDDKIVQVSESRNLTAAIRERGGNVKYSEYAGVGHNVWLNALAEKELLPWLLSQKAEN